MFETDPISRIEWRDASTLKSNDYNPNSVMSPEMKLLERSILLTGWVQPLLVTDDGTIIDGFHRATLSRASEALRARYNGFAPCAVLDVPRDKAMILTIRMNRAKGTHVAIRMSKIVRELLDEFGYEPEELAREIGATKDEIDLLHQEGVFKAKDIANYSYGFAWYPVEKDSQSGGEAA